MKFLHSFLKDLRLAFKSYYLYMELAFALIYVAIMLLAVPDSFSRSFTVYVWADEPRLAAALDLSRSGENHAGDEDAAVAIEARSVASRDELYEAMDRNRGSIGLILTAAGGAPRLKLVFQGYESRRFRNILEAALREGLAASSLTAPGLTPSGGGSGATETFASVTTLEGSPGAISDRMGVVPVFLTMNAAFMGLFIIAAYVFADKEEGTIKAFAVTPARVWHYLAGKLCLMLVAGAGSALISTALIAGPNADYGLLIMLVVATNAFGSALGLFIASFFDSLSKAMGCLYLAIVILGLSTASYYLPSFSPLPIRLLPSYPMLFAYREILLPKPDTAFVWLTGLGFAAAAAALFILANIRFKRSLTV